MELLLGCIIGCCVSDGSSELRTLLENPHLQTLLRHVDASRDVERDVTAAMQEPLFQEFADVCLRTIEPERFPPDVTQ